MHSFLCYIDESGDEGFGNYRQPFAQGGASRWLIIGGCLIRASRSLEVVRWRDEIRSTCRPIQRKRDIHFQDFSHSERRAACTILSTKPVRFTSVLGCKERLESEDLKGRNKLYFYLTRFLLERVTWLCRDLRSEVSEGDGRVKIVFSRRGGMSYEGFRDYLYRLKADPEVSIRWPLVDIDSIDAQDHSRVAGLQLADFGVSAIAQMIERDRFGQTENGYAETLRKNIFHRGSNYRSYGLKVFPSMAEILEVDPIAHKNLERWGG